MDIIDRTSRPKESPQSRFNATAAITPRNSYLQQSKTLTYSYLFTLPLFIIYEGGSWLLSLDGGSQVRLGADLMVRRFLAWIGLGGTLWLAGLVIVAGAAIMFAERRKGIVLKGRYLLLMLVESTAYAFVVGSLVATLVGSLVGRIPALQAAPMPGSPGLVDQIVLSLGAGLYEELIFRLVLVSALYAFLGLLPIPRTPRYIIAAIVGAAIFSYVHYLGPLGYAFTLSSFLFRAFMGLALNVLFLTRGFGIAAMTHSVYDVIVTLIG